MKNGKAFPGGMIVSLYKHDRAMDATRLETASHCTHNICGVFAVHHCVPGLFAGGVSVHDSCCTI